MKVSVNFKAIVLATQVKEGKEGRKFYSASIFMPESDGEVGNIGMSEEAYKSCVPNITQIQDLTAEYNDKYNSFRIVGVN